MFILTAPKVSLCWITPDPLLQIELAGRTCWKSEGKLEPGSDKPFVQMLLRKGHEAMLEHASMSLRFICDRGVTHEIVRHRIASYAQESTRYCNYRRGVEFIIPSWLDLPAGVVSLGNEATPGSLFRIGNTPVVDDAATKWLADLHHASQTYQYLLNKGWAPQQARSVLPNALKTEIVMTANMREWRHFFALRCAAAAHPDMRKVGCMALDIVRQQVPILFDEYVK